MSTQQNSNEMPSTVYGLVSKAVPAVLGTLNRMAGLLAELVAKKSKPRLFYRGKEIILFDDLTTVLKIHPRTSQRYRSSGLIEYYVSRDGHTIFMTSEQLDRYFDTNFVLSTSTEAEEMKIKKRRKHPDG